MKIKIIFIFIFVFSIILICLVNNKLIVGNNNKYEVLGKAEKITRYKDENLILINKSVPINRAKILIVSGKVRHISHSNYIKISNIQSPKIYTYSNHLGEFSLILNPGEYTFFLVINDMAYLNSFRKDGNFSSMKINSDVYDLLITDFRDVSF